MFRTLAVVAVLLAVTPTFASDPSLLDPSFGVGGTMTVGGSTPKGLVLQPDGKIVLGGGEQVGDHRGFQIDRFDATGALDSTFGSDGVVVTRLGVAPYETDSVNALVLEPDGRLTAGGSFEWFFPPSTVVAGGMIVRYEPDGTLDPTFNGGVPLQLGLPSNAMVRQPDGRYVVGGTSNGFALRRFNADGSTDGTFGSGGTVTTVFGNPVYAASLAALALQSDGAIVAVGFASDYGANQGNHRQRNFAVVRYLADGTLDPAFGTGGIVETPLGVYLDEARAVVVLGDGKILVAGISYASLTGPASFALVRYEPDGVLDVTFGVGGVVETRIGGTSHADGLLPTSEGGTFALGTAVVAAPGGSQSVFAVARYASDGRLDRAFGADGTIMTPFDGDATATAGALQPDGRLVVGGGPFAFRLARFRGVACGSGHAEVCRPADGPCDVAEACDGVGNDCPVDAHVTDGLACDDGPACTTGAACQAGVCGALVADGTPCDDDPCTVGSEWCQSGHCLGGTPLVCAPCEACGGVAGCVPSPRVACGDPFVAGRSLLSFRHDADPGKDAVQWDWKKGTATSVSDFGDPTTTDDYALCVYDVSGATPVLDVRAVAPAGCDAISCWSANKSGFKYRGVEHLGNGLTRVALKAGADGKALVTVRGGGSTLQTPALPPTLPLLVQLHGPGGRCWQARYDSGGVAKSDGTRFKARDTP